MSCFPCTATPAAVISTADAVALAIVVAAAAATTFATASTITTYFQSYYENDDDFITTANIAEASKNTHILLF